MSLPLNAKAPSFKLYNTSRKEVSLEEHAGKNLVLLFFPLAFTSTCTTELCTMRDNMNIYESLDAVVYGLSCDSHYVLAKFRNENNLQFELLSDFNRDASRAYNCLYETFGLGMKLVPKRASFVIDRSGILRHAEVLENAGQLPDFEKIQQCLKSFQIA